MRYLDFPPFPTSVGSSSGTSYNLARVDDNHYRISVSVAGFSRSELSIESKDKSLKISGTRSSDSPDTEFVVRGISTNNFERQFHLADHVEVKDATLEHGLLHIDLVRELPESLRSRKIDITDSSARLSQAA